MDDRRVRAYRAGSRAAKARMVQEAPLDAKALDEVRASDIVVVDGCYDHVHRVLEALEMPFTRVSEGQLGRLPLRPDQLLIVNCPGHVGRTGMTRVREFVSSGGALFTTDWALTLLQHALPGYVEYNRRPTGDDVVRIEMAAHDNPFLRGVIDPSDEPLWWLEGSSYPIKVLRPDAVEVLIRSTELERKYGEAPVAVRFDHGSGEVFHMISHYYLQRTETRGARHASASAGWFAEKGLAPDAEAADLNLAEVESAASSARMMANIVADRKRKTAK